jgi:hypothetical protein
MNDTVKVMEVKQVKEVTAFLCPICKNTLNAYNDATGWTVRCDQPIAVCSATENPSAHGKNQKIAYEILVEKLDFAIKDRSVKKSKS